MLCVDLQGKSESSTKAPEPPTRNIHHFCKMTSEFQLPHEFRHIGRKYHAPDLYRGVFPDQPYRVRSCVCSLVSETVWFLFVSAVQLARLVFVCVCSPVGETVGVLFVSAVQLARLSGFCLCLQCSW